MAGGELTGIDTLVVARWIAAVCQGISVQARQRGQPGRSACRRGAGHGGLASERFGVNYRRRMRNSSLTKAVAALGAVVLVLGACADDNAPPAATGPCSIVENGTPAPKTSPQASGEAGTSRNISSKPEVATGYRKDMTAVRTNSYSVVTANPLATQAACGVLRDGGTAADALIAAQTVLGLVEPQSSGIGVEEYFLNPDGSPKASGTRLNNPGYSKTLGTIASDPQSFYSGDIASDIVAAAADTSGGRTPSLMTREDLSGYTVTKREPLCIPYRGREICGMPPPSSGGIAVAATLGVLEHFPMSDYKPTDLDRNGGHPSVMGVHLISEAERLAYADRDKYVADTDFIALPGGSPDALINSAYLTGRAGLISDQRSMGTAKPGEFGPPTAPAPPTVEHGTSQISIVDAQDNAASMTTTVESAFGSFHMVDGFILDNQLTDFAADPLGPDGVPVPNRVQPGKRPRSTMAPTLIFDQAASGRGRLYAVTGSPGGSTIIQFVVKTVVGMLDWGLDPQQAVSMADFGAANSPKTNVGGEHPNIDTADNGDRDPLVAGLRRLGHQVDLADQSSGLSAIVRDDAGWIGGADPRREGLVMGDTR